MGSHNKQTKSSCKCCIYTYQARIIMTFDTT